MERFIYMIFGLSMFFSSCGGKRVEQKEVMEIPDSVTTVYEEPKYEPSTYSSIGDTIVINDLYIVLDSVVIKIPEQKKVYGGSSRLKARSKMLLAYVEITNKGKETKEIPFVNIKEEIRRRKSSEGDGGFSSIHISGYDEDDLRPQVGSRLFYDAKKKDLALSIKPRQTLKGNYQMNFSSFKFSVLSFWYFDGSSGNEQIDNLAKMSESYTLEGKNVMKIVPGDAELNDVGFDITELLKKE